MKLLNKIKIDKVVYDNCKTGGWEGFFNSPMYGFRIKLENCGEIVGNYIEIDIDRMNFYIINHKEYKYYTFEYYKYMKDFIILVTIGDGYSALVSGNDNCELLIGYNIGYNFDSISVNEYIIKKILE